MNYVEQFRARFAHVVMLLLWTNAGVLALAPAGASGLASPAALAGAGFVLACLGSAAWALFGTGWITRQVTTAACLGQVMLLVYAYSGHPYQPDTHMYFFAVLAVLSGWLDWRIFVTGTVAIAAHHGGMSLLYSDGVFPGGNDIRRVGVHAAIVIVQALALSWIVINLSAALETSALERENATSARLVAENTRQELATVTRQAETERRSMLTTVADEFERTIAGIARGVLSSIEALRVAARQMTAGAMDVAAGASTAAESSQRVSSNVVAARRATEEMAASIEEIERQVVQSSLIVEATTHSAKEVAATVARLSANADDIDNIVGLISTIAGQTNLLALNASIEAARYGAAGGGFAVVAQEVKALAGETSRATANIQRQITAIRQSSSEALSAIDIMNEMIGSLNDVSTAVAAVVGQQAQATVGIGNTIELAARETLAVSDTISVVDRVAAESGSAAGFVATSADRLSVQAGQLDTEVAQFLGRVRNA